MPIKMELIIEPIFQIFMSPVLSNVLVLNPSNIMGEKAGVSTNCGNLNKVFLLPLMVLASRIALAVIDITQGSRYITKRYSGEIMGSMDLVYFPSKMLT